MNQEILLFTETSSPRLSYTCQFIFTEQLGMAFRLTTDRLAFETFSGPKLNYSKQAVQAPLTITPHSLLFEDGVYYQDITVVDYGGIKVPFANGGAPFPFDVLTAIFYLLSRYEEYLPFEKNQYEQFKATDSLAYQLGFLQVPVVDRWIEALKMELRRHFPSILFKEKKFKARFTYDIDTAYAYRGRPFAITAGNMLNDLLHGRLNKIKERLAVLTNREKDPFDTYDHILEQKELYGHQLLFFFLVGQKNKYNRNLDPSGETLQKLIRQIAAKAETGIHPSYYTCNDYQLLETEKKKLEHISGKTVYVSRQHYLRLEFPGSYRNLIQAGITEDYTLGFAEEPGFRAGTCSSFYFYDLGKNEATSLLLHPFTFMEGSFIEDMNLTAAETAKKMKVLLEEVKKVNGHFITIWHNHTLSNINEWKNLEAVHDELTALAANR